LPDARTSTVQRGATTGSDVGSVGVLMQPVAADASVVTITKMQSLVMVRLR